MYIKLKQCGVYTISYRAVGSCFVIDEEIKWIHFIFSAIFQGLAQREVLLRTDKIQSVCWQVVSVFHTICLKGYSPYLKTIFNVYIPTLNVANPVVSNNVLELRTSPQLSLEFEVMKRTTLWLKSTTAVLTYVRISCSKGVFQKSAAYYLFSRCVINKNVFNIF